MKRNRILFFIDKYQENELIFASELYKNKLDNEVTEEAFYKTLERLYKQGILAKLSKGIYYRPKKTKYGIIPPSEEEISSIYTKKNNGIVVGYNMFNRLGLTTQIPKNTIIYSSALDKKTKNIGSIKIIKFDLQYTESVKHAIEIMEVLDSFENIQNINYYAFLNICKQFAINEYNEKIMEKVITKLNYSKSTIAFLCEILKKYKIENNLNRHLSTLSNYKIPKWEMQ